MDSNRSDRGGDEALLQFLDLYFQKETLALLRLSPEAHRFFEQALPIRCELERKAFVPKSHCARD